MKLDFIIDSLDGGGAERVMATLINSLSNENDITLITLNPGSKYPINKNITKIDLHHGSLKNHTLRSLKNLFSYYQKKQKKPDFIIVFLPENALYTIPISKFYGIKVIVSEHTNHTANVTRKRKISRKLVYPFATGVTVLTSFDFKYFKKINKNTFIMPNPVILNEKITDYEERKKSIIAAGALNRYKDKGFDSLLRITAPLLQNHTDWNLIILGGGEKGISALKNLSKELKIENQLILPGFCENINEVMQESQIFVLTSKFEGLPMVLMEALSNGLACIAYDCVSGPRDLINNEKNGLLIEDQNSTAFQQALENLLIDSELRKKIAAAGPSSMKPYNLPEIVKKWHQLFNQL